MQIGMQNKPFPAEKGVLILLRVTPEFFIRVQLSVKPPGSGEGFSASTSRTVPWFVERVQHSILS